MHNYICIQQLLRSKIAFSMLKKGIFTRAPWCKTRSKKNNFFLSFSPGPGIHKSTRRAKPCRHLTARVCPFRRMTFFFAARQEKTYNSNSHVSGCLNPLARSLCMARRLLPPLLWAAGASSEICRNAKIGLHATVRKRFSARGACMKQESPRAAPCYGLRLFTSERMALFSYVALMCSAKGRGTTQGFMKTTLEKNSRRNGFADN